MPGRPVTVLERRDGDVTNGLLPSRIWKRDPPSELNQGEVHKRIRSIYFNPLHRKFQILEIRRVKCSDIRALFDS